MVLSNFKHCKTGASTHLYYNGGSSSFNQQKQSCHMLARNAFYDPGSSYVFTFIQKTCFVDFILCGEKQRLTALFHLRF